MYKFTVEYYYRRYQTGELNTEVTRTAILFANDRPEAFKKISQADGDFICSKRIMFEEMEGDSKWLS